MGRSQSEHAARQLIDAFLLDELDEVSARELAGHVRSCPSCAAELGGTTRLLELLRTLPEPAASRDLDERIITAALADRSQRDARRAAPGGLFGQILRGAMRTTGTLVVTVVAVALIGGAFVFAASQFIAPVFNPKPDGDTARATVSPVATQTVAPTEPTHRAVPTASPSSGVETAPARTPVPVAPTPIVIFITPPPTAAPEPTPVVAPAPTPTPVVVVETPAVTASPDVSASPEVTASPEISASPEPTATPTPEPTATATPEPTPEPSDSPTPTATATPTATPEPTETPTPTPSESGSPKPRRTPPPSAQPGAPTASPDPGTPITSP